MVAPPPPPNILTQTERLKHKFSSYDYLTFINQKIKASVFGSDAITQLICFSCKKVERRVKHRKKLGKITGYSLLIESY